MTSWTLGASVRSVIEFLDLSYFCSLTSIVATTYDDEYLTVAEGHTGFANNTVAADEISGAVCHPQAIEFGNAFFLLEDVVVQDLKVKSASFQLTLRLLLHAKKGLTFIG